MSIYMGVETELACFMANGTPYQNAAEPIISWIAEHDAFEGYLPGFGTYEDCGNHLETYTPILDHPRNVAIAMRAMDLALEDVIAGMSVDEVYGSLGCDVMRSSSDPVANSTWGCHENISNGLDFYERLVQHSDGYYRARAVSTGLMLRHMACLEGGVSNMRGGLKPSPRACWMRAEFANHTTSDRGMFGQKDNGKRLHIICAASNMSDWQNIVKIGMAGLIADWAAKCDIAQIHSTLKRIPIGDESAYTVSPVGAICSIGRYGIQGSHIEGARVLIEELDAFPHTRVPWRSEILGMFDDCVNAYANEDDDWLSYHIDYYIKKMMFGDSLEALGQKQQLVLSSAMYHNVSRERGLHKIAVADDLVYSSITDEEAARLTREILPGPTKLRIEMARVDTETEVTRQLRETIVGRYILTMEDVVTEACIAGMPIEATSAHVKALSELFIQNAIKAVSVKSADGVAGRVMEVAHWWIRRATSLDIDRLNKLLAME